MPTVNEAKNQLDDLIKKSRIHLYKPIRIAETLYHHRMGEKFEPLDIESYRSLSRKWAEDVSIMLVGRKSTSSMRYQDNIFDNNAIPPDYLAILLDINERGHPGKIEAYIYSAFLERHTVLTNLWNDLNQATPLTFNLHDFISNFETEPGLRRSIDKCFEIIVYAFFDSVVQYMGVTVSLGIPQSNIALLEEFDEFANIVMGISPRNPSISIPARLYRAGVTNAADRGLDMWANFGPAVQVKHVSLTKKLVDEIDSEVADDARLLIVCSEADKDTLGNIMNQSGFSSRIQGIITQAQLEQWYSSTLRGHSHDKLGAHLIRCLQIEFEKEFPSEGNTYKQFYEQRGYDKLNILSLWE